MNLSKIPSVEDWGDIGGDFDAIDAYRSFAGRSNPAAQKLLKENVLARAQELRFMPDAPFVYYMKAFCDLVVAGEFGDADPWSVADSFLSVTESRAAGDCAVLQPISSDIRLALAKLVVNQTQYGADRDIFGDFSDRAERINKCLQKED